MLVSALVIFLKCWLSNQRRTEGIMHPWCIFPLVAVSGSLILRCIGFSENLTLSRAAKKGIPSCSQFGRKEYHKNREPAL